MSAAELLALAERVERAEGPDREIDALVAAAAGVIDFEGRYAVLGTPFFRVTDDGLRVEFCTRLDDGSEHCIASRKPRPFTASLDAALSLADGLERYGGASGLLNEAWSRLSRRFNLHITNWPEGESYAAWLARFVTAAALRARAQAPQSHPRADAVAVVKEGRGK